jgi:cyclase
MKNKRVIARLDVKNNSLVKGIHLEGLRVLGRPELFAGKYYIDGIDEILYMDVVASLYGRNGLLDLVKQTAKNIFVPLTVGGGIRTIEDVRLLLASGADKVCINTAAVKNKYLISDISKKYGSSTLVVAIEAIKVDGQYMIFIDNGREYTGISAVDWAQEIEALGAGEILLTSVDQEGTGSGLDYELISQIQAVTSVPLIAHGGVGCANDFYEAFFTHHVDAVCAASIFHYNALSEFKYSTQDVQGNTSFLTSRAVKPNIQDISIIELKNELKQRGVLTR